MRFQILIALELLLAVSLPSWADGDVAANVGNTPKEVGTTSMHAGTYALTDQSSGRTYSLLVTNEGHMILQPAQAASASQGQNSQAPKPEDKKQILEKGMEQGAVDLFKSGAFKGL